MSDNDTLNSRKIDVRQHLRNCGNFDKQKSTEIMAFKINQEVILHDPVSGEPVNFGIIKAEHADLGFYEVEIHRLNNHFVMNWHEDLMRPSTPELFAIQENHLNTVELISLHLVDQANIRFIPAEHTLDIPASFAQHSNLLRYIEMDIDGKKNGAY